MAVTAYPVILINDSDAGSSDTACSGAGPATALTGSSASTDSGGTVVTLDGSPDLSGVATDGSHVIYLNDAAANARRFAAINAKDDGADTVTVEQAFTGSLSGKSWAIGGIRDTLAGSDSSMLYNRDGADGDAEPGWIVELGDGYTETVTSSIDWQAEGTNQLLIVLRGESGASSIPSLTSSGGSPAIEFSDFVSCKGFEVLQATANGNGIRIRRSAMAQRMIIKQTHATSNNGYGVEIWSRQAGVVECYIEGFENRGINTIQPYSAYAYGSYFKGCGPLRLYTGSVINCIFDSSNGVAILVTLQSGDYSTTVIANNTIFNASGDGIEVSGAPTNGNGNAFIANNIMSDNGGYGLEVTNSAWVEENVELLGVITGNLFHNNSSGNMNLGGVDTDFGENYTTGVDPFDGTPTTDFTPNSNAAGVGFPGAFHNLATTVSYMDAGAVQREEPAGGGGLILINRSNSLITR
jgi:hypothetical protein